MTNSTDTTKPQGLFVKQRAFTRVPFAHQVRWNYAPGEAGVAEICNISRGGLCLAMGRYLRPGRVLTLRFDDISFKGQPLEFDTRIVWCDSVPDELGFFNAGFQVLHGKPVTLAKISEVFYAAITRLAHGYSGSGFPCAEPIAPTLKSPSLAS
jgi:hypothetical protein